MGTASISAYSGRPSLFKAPACRVVAEKVQQHSLLVLITAEHQHFSVGLLNIMPILISTTCMPDLHVNF